MPEYYWQVSTAHGQLIIDKEHPDIAGIPPIYRNNMDLDCFELARLFAANPAMQTESPDLWLELQRLVSYTEETWMQKVQPELRSLFDNRASPKIKPALRKARVAKK
jgi:hypothetical protein